MTALNQASDQETPQSLGWMGIWRRMMRLSGSNSQRLKAGVFWIMAAAISQGLALACILPIFNALFVSEQSASVVVWLIIMTLFTGGSMVARWLGQGFDFNGHMAQTTHQIRSRLGRRLRMIPLERLRGKRTGEINATLLGNVDENLAYIITVTNLLFCALLCPLIVALCSFYYDWRMAVLLLLLFPSLIPLYRWLAPKFTRGIDEYVKAHHVMNANIVEYIQGIEIIRSSGCVGSKAEQLQRSFEHIEQLQTQGQKSGAKPNVLISSIFELGLFGVFVSGLYFVHHGWSQLPIIAALLVIVMRYAEPLASFVGYTKVIHLIEASLLRIEALLEIEALPQQPAELPTRFDIALENVSFRYHDSKSNELDNISFSIPTCSLTALVGPSGSGKTTVTRMITRYADPQKGRITIGGIDVRAIEPDKLSQLISVVFQDVYLFDDTILANIRMASPESTDEEVEQAAKAANCHDFIALLPQGYRTRVGDIGGRLSGGERQRISIARAILKDSPILILDEPTAALDTENEVAVQRAIDHLVQNKTVIVIAHRLSTIANARKIVVIESGQLVEAGDHQDLLARNHRYTDLWKAQHRAKYWNRDVIAVET